MTAAVRRETPHSAVEPKRRMMTPEKRAVIQAIVQIAVRIFFVLSVLALAALTIPFAAQAIALPLILIGAATISAFFFEREQEAFLQSDPVAETFVPTSHQMPEDIPAQAPRGLYRQGMNCWLNSILNLCECDPAVARWMRTPVPNEREPFIAYMQQYGLPDDLLDPFRRAEVRPGANLQDLFACHLADYEPNKAYAAEFLKFRDHIYPNLFIVQPAFSQFFRAYDQALEQNLAVVHANSQVLRLVLSRVSGEIKPSSDVQSDAGAALSIILDLLPNEMKVHVEEENHYNVEGRPPIDGCPDGITRKREPAAWGFAIQMDPTEKHPNLAKMFHNYCNEERDVPDPKEWVALREGERYQPIRRKFELLEFPTALRLQVKRTESKGPEKSKVGKCMAALLPSSAWRAEKIHTKITVPDQLAVPKKGGEQKNYRLAAIAVHKGASMHSGHYVAYRRIEQNDETNHYSLDDQVVTRIDQQEWERAASEACLYYYLPDR